MSRVLLKAKQPELRQRFVHAVVAGFALTIAACSTRITAEEPSSTEEMPAGYRYFIGIVGNPSSRISVGATMS